MLSEIVVEAALQAIFGESFKEVIQRVFKQNPKASDQEVLTKILHAIQSQTSGVYDLKTRLRQIEMHIGSLTDGQRRELPSAVREEIDTTSQGVPRIRLVVRAQINTSRRG